MSDERIHGISIQEWEAAFRPGLPEYVATRFSFTVEDGGLLRIAFANGGPFVSGEGARSPVSTCAVTVPADLAVELAHQLLKSVAEPESNRPPPQKS